MIVLPGGRIGTDNLRKSELVREQSIAFAADKYIAAICAAPTVFAKLGLLDGKKATVHPDFKDAMGKAEVLDGSVVIDGNVITGQGLGATIPFSLELVKALVNETKAEQLRTAICYHS